MQRVSHEYKLISPLMELIELLYYRLSDVDFNEFSPLIPMNFPISFEDTVNTFSNNGYDFDVQYAEQSFRVLDIPQEVKDNDNTIVVCVSGGKDSLATTLYYVERGYDVKLFHLKGLNKCYPDEHKAIENAAEYLGLPLVEWAVKLHGNHCYVEHPLKNWILMNAALTYAIRDVGTVNVSVGNFKTNYLIDNKFDVCAGDTIDLWELYEGILHEILPEFKVLIPLENVRETLAVFEDKRDLLEISQSCIGTYRFKEYRGNLIRNKYKYPLMPHRCGVCWKCAVEYIYYADRDVLEYNEEYYKHCLKILYDVMRTENDFNDYSATDVWCNFLLIDDMDNSKLKNIRDLNMKGLR